LKVFAVLALYNNSGKLHVWHLPFPALYTLA
jgi:hypothetical protein